MRFTVATPPEHRSSLDARLSAELRGRLEWRDAGPADVVIGCPGEASLAACERWPGLDGAVALVEAGHERLKDRADMDRLHEVGRALA